VDGMNEVYPNIFIIENFLTEEEHSYVMSLITESEYNSWENTTIKEIEKKYKNNLEQMQQALESRNEFWDDKIFKIHDEQFWKSLTEKVNNFFENKYEINPMYAIQRQQPNTFLKIHFDQGNNPDLEKAVIIYLNDDYNGGELFFPDHNFEIKPPARSMIIFPGTEDYMHGVKEVLDGPTRYVMPSFGFKKNANSTSY
jgi:predicted 2-oxoglutarate/Fe(II)-dependent dioxygenase YbiX